MSEELIYCHNRKCERDDCIRKEIYMPFNVCCKRRDFDCNKSNGYKDFLGEETSILESEQESEIKESVISESPKEVEISKENEIHISETTQESELTYLDYLNQITEDENIWFYIEPFVGNTDSISLIAGKCAKYGTDLDKEKIDALCEKFPDRVKNFQVRDYKTWDKVLLNDKYAGHCVVYCEPPYINKPDEFSMKEFLEIINKWVSKNRVFVRMPQKAKNWEFVCKVTSASSMFEVKK